MSDSAAAHSPTSAQGEERRRNRLIKPSFVIANLLFVATLVAIAIPGKVTPKTSVPFYVAVVIIELLYIWRYLAGGRKRSTSNIARPI